MHKKIAFIGSLGSGKTTIIEHLTQINAFNTDIQLTENMDRKMTTLGIDYGQINIDKTTSFGLYGVPGQRKFSFIWDFVKVGLWATVILVKNNDQTSVNELNYLLDYFEISSNSLCLIGVTHADINHDEKTYHKVQNILDHKKLIVPVYTIDSRTSKCTELIINTLIAIEEQCFHEL